MKGLDGTRIAQGREREGNDEVSKQAITRTGLGQQVRLLESVQSSPL